MKSIAYAITVTLISSALHLGTASDSPSMQNLTTHPSGHVRIPLQVTEDVRVAYQISDDKLKNGVSRALFYAEKLLNTYNDNGVADSEIDLHLVFHGDGTNALVNEETRKRLGAEGGTENPNRALIDSLVERGVSIELCESSMEQREVTSEHLADGVATVRGAFPRLIELQLLGYAYIKFE